MSDDNPKSSFYGPLIAKAAAVVKGVEVMTPRERMLYLQGATFGFAAGAELLNAALVDDDGKDSPGIVITFLQDGAAVREALTQSLNEAALLTNLPDTATRH